MEAGDLTDGILTEIPTGATLTSPIPANVQQDKRNLVMSLFDDRALQRKPMDRTTETMKDVGREGTKAEPASSPRLHEDVPMEVVALKAVPSLSGRKRRKHQRRNSFLIRVDKKRQPFPLQHLQHSGTEDVDLLAVNAMDDLITCQAKHRRRNSNCTAITAAMGDSSTSVLLDASLSALSVSCTGSTENNVTAATSLPTSNHHDLGISSIRSIASYPKMYSFSTAERDYVTELDGRRGSFHSCTSMQDVGGGSKDTKDFCGKEEDTTKQRLHASWADSDDTKWFMDLESDEERD